jgi:signal peptidase II
MAAALVKGFDMQHLMSRKSRLVTLVILLLTLVGCDQASKQYATAHLRHTAVNPIIMFGETFEIRYAENPGAFLSLFANLPQHVRFWLLTVMNGTILSGVAVFLLRRHAIDRWSFVALALLLAGGIGNLIDRVSLGGFVIDFMVIDLAAETGIPWLKTGVFNVADMAITAGFILLLPQLFRKEPKAPTPAGAPA